MKLLITGFEPFGGESINPSYQAVKRLRDKIGGLEIVKLELPVAFDRGREALEAAIKAHRPGGVLCVGQAGGQAAIAVERVAINLAEAHIPDNDGAQPREEPLVPGGPAAYFATVPTAAMVQRIQEAGTPCVLSYTAGSYVCNCVMYHALHLAATEYPGLLAGFIHVPYTPQQAAQKPGGTASMALEEMVKALECGAEVIGEKILANF